jgi:hypothetical protein
MQVTKHRDSAGREQDCGGNMGSMRHYGNGGKHLKATGRDHKLSFLSLAFRIFASRLAGSIIIPMEAARVSESETGLDWEGGSGRTCQLRSRR